MYCLYWKLSRASRPTWSGTSRLAHMRALQRLLVAGTAGTFFFAIARKLPLDVESASLQWDAKSTIEHVLRYGYLLWLFAYFFLSSVHNDQTLAADTTIFANAKCDNWKVAKKAACTDLAFYALQAMLAITSAVGLGFINNDIHFTQKSAYIISNFTVLAIAGLSLGLFRESTGLMNGVNLPRILGGICAGVSLILMLDRPLTRGVLILLAALHAVLWLCLFIFGRLRVDVT